MSWLKTVPEDQNLPRYATLEKIEKFEVGYNHLIEIFNDLLESNTISFLELKAYCEFNGLILNPWQSQMIIEMLNEYYSFATKAKNKNCYSPLLSEDEIEQVEMNGILNHMRSFNR